MNLSSPTKKVIAIFVLFLVSLFINLPAEVPLKIHFGGLNYETNYKRPNLNFSIGKYKVNKKGPLFWEPLLKLHLVQLATRLSSLSNPPSLLGIT